MSSINKALPNESVIPIIESRVFDEHPDARFAVGKLAIGNQALPGLEQEHAAYYDLRRKVYVEQTGQLDESALNEDGTDRDADDSRSVAFGIIENLGSRQRLVGSMRLIHKGFKDATGKSDDRPLPVEEFCPGIFEDNPAPINSLEVSRYIVRHEKASMQRTLKWPLFSAALAHITGNNLGPTYAVIEEWLEKDFKSYLPMERIGEPRFVPEYLDVNLPIKIHTDQLAANIESKTPGAITEMQRNDGRMSYFGRLAVQAASTEEPMAIAG